MWSAHVDLFIESISCIGDPLTPELLADLTSLAVNLTTVPESVYTCVMGRMGGGLHLAKVASRILGYSCGQDY